MLGEVEQRQWCIYSKKMNSPIKIWRDHKKISELLGKKGKIVSWTRSDKHSIALVETFDRERMVIQISGHKYEDLKTGGKIKLVLRRIGNPEKNEVIKYGIKAQLI